MAVHQPDNPPPSSIPTKQKQTDTMSCDVFCIKSPTSTNQTKAPRQYPNRLPLASPKAKIDYLKSIKPQKFDISFRNYFGP